jgi:hypothetical protein
VEVDPMRRQVVSWLVAWVAWVALAGTSYAQGAPRFEVGPLVRVDHVRVEGDLTGAMPVAGLTVSQRILKSMSMEAEITWATGTLRRHYSGEFVSFAPPGSSVEEIERLSPTVRRDLSYAPGWGGAAAMVWRRAVSPRMDVAFRAGLSGRSYVETSTFTILTTPPGVDPVRLAQVFVDTRERHSRGGLLFGVDAPVRVTPRFRVVPEVRLVYGPRQVGNAHREWGVSLRGVWGL